VLCLLLVYNWPGELFVAGLHILGPFFFRPQFNLFPRSIICLRQDAVPIGLMSGDLTELMQHGKLRVKDKSDGRRGRAQHMSFAVSMEKITTRLDPVTARQMYWGWRCGEMVGRYEFLYTMHYQP
jgi:hypothetical protein